MKGYKHLTEFDRNKIARMRKEGATMREIGAALHVSAATVCREIKRGTYTYMNADYIEVTEYIPERSQARYRANMAAKGGPPAGARVSVRRQRAAADVVCCG